jgi:nicotinate-nucleotide pyrophosphorylase (carboxylating)
LSVTRARIGTWPPIQGFTQRTAEALKWTAYEIRVPAEKGAPVPTESVLREYARRALDEDLGAGDVTTNLLLSPTTMVTANLVARSAGVVCGLGLARAVFLELDPTLDVRVEVPDGTAVEAGAVLLTVQGAARPILSAERAALNFVGRLSGVASLTRSYVEAADGTGARIVDTRKTTPGLRVLEKYAVRCGGGHNHRFGLGDGFMVKDNHRAALRTAGRDVGEAVRGARERLGHGVAVTIEVDDVEEIAEALEAGADSVLLDNMTPEQLALAVRQIDGEALIEASGGITLESVRAVAETGVDLISVGALTHSAPSLDVALEFEWQDTRETS